LLADGALPVRGATMRHSASAFQLGGSAPVLGTPGGGGRAAAGGKKPSSGAVSAVVWPLVNAVLLGVVAHFALDNSYAAPALPTSRSTAAEDAFREGGGDGAWSTTLLDLAAAAGGPAPSAAPGTAGADYTCDAAAGGAAPASSPSSSWDAAGLTASLQSSLPSAYLNDTTVCQQLGPTCVAEGGHLVLYAPELQPANGTYRHLDGKRLPVLAALRRVMHLVGWGGPGGGNPDVWNGNIRTFDGETVHAWPAGPGAAPPVPFSDCTHPLALFWDFPENYWHTLAVYSAVWAAVARHGALDGDVTLALGLPPTGVTHVQEYLYGPLLAAVTSGAVTTLGHLGAHGVTHARAVGAAAPAAAGAGATAKRAGGGGGSQPLDHRIVAVPPVRCFARFTACSVAGYHALPPPPMFDFMQAVKRALLARRAAPSAAAAAGGVEAAAAERQRQAYAAALAEMGPPPPPPAASAAKGAPAPSAAPPACVWPAGANYVTGPGGVLRVTLAMRKEGTRRVLNADELLAACKEAGRVALGDFSSTSGGSGAAAAATAPTVPVACEAYRFGSGAGGMVDDALKMHNTDVLVAVHGAGLTNLGFLRPGAIVVELRPLGFDAANADRFYRPLARRSGCLKWWGVLLHEPYQQPGVMQAARRGNPSKYTRDRDLLVPWEGVAAAIGSAAGTSYDGWLEREARALTHVM
jgi:hypothetical protein